MRLFRFLGGVPRLIVPDNLKSGVHKASFYDPEINRNYGMMAAHYGVGVLPARPRKPRDKAKVEAGVTSPRPTSSAGCDGRRSSRSPKANAAIATAMERINAHVMRRLGVSRRELFESIERPALRPLPSDDYEYAEWRLARVNLDYHVEAAGFLYSVPHALIRQQVDVLRLTNRTVEIFTAASESQLTSAAMARAPAWRTDPEHMPSAHRRYAEWTPERFQRWALRSGRTPRGWSSRCSALDPIPSRASRTCLGILRLFRGLDPAQAEAVAARAVAIGALTCQSLASILAHNLDRARRQPEESVAVIDHPNVRGPRYFRLTEIPHARPSLSTSSTPSACTAWPRAIRRSLPTPKARARTRRVARPAARARGDAAPPEALRDPRPRGAGCVIPPASRTSFLHRRAGLDHLIP